MATPMPKLRMYTMPLTSFCAYLNGTADAHHVMCPYNLYYLGAPPNLRDGQGTPSSFEKDIHSQA